MYLDIVPKKFGTILSRLLLSPHHLNIEVGRHGSNIVERHQRLCLLCDKHDVDEYHFTLIYPIYLHFRKRCIMSYVFKRPIVHMFIELMQCPNKHTLKHLGKYLCEAFALRKSLVNKDSSLFWFKIVYVFLYLYFELAIFTVRAVSIYPAV